MAATPGKKKKNQELGGGKGREEARIKYCLITKGLCKAGQMQGAGAF
jgi:hypothetical protein